MYILLKACRTWIYPFYKNTKNLDQLASDETILFVCLFDSLRPINNLSDMQGRVFLG